MKKSIFLAILFILFGLNIIKSQSLYRATVSATQMNLLYAGVANPIDVSVSGIPDEKVKVEIDDGTIYSTDKLGSYTVRVKKPGIVYINVFFTDNEGKIKSAGKYAFRVKMVPDPVAIINGKTGGEIKKSVFLSQKGITVQLEQFDFDIRFDVTGFTLCTVVDSFYVKQPSTSNEFTEKQKSLVRNSKKGQRFLIENIKAKGPDETERELAPLRFKIK